MCLGLVAELETGAPGTGGLGTPSVGLEAALENLHEYCNGMIILRIGIYALCNMIVVVTTLFLYVSEIFLFCFNSCNLACLDG
jgi:hypothetical protein